MTHFDARPQSADLEPGFAQAVQPRPRWSPWLTTEVAAIRAHYQTGGAPAVRSVLPHRTLASIRAKASEMGIRCARPSTLGHSFARVYPPSEAVDMAIRDGYLRATKKGDVKALADRIGRPAWWVQKRAAKFGLTRCNRTRLDAWTPAEVALLEKWRMAQLPVIRRKLAEAGFARTEAGIAVQLKRRQIDRTDPNAWSATQLGQLFGVNPATVADWVDRRGLPGRKADGRTGAFSIRRTDLRLWIKRNPQWVDLRRVDQAWFWELMFPEMAQPTQKKAEG